MRVLSVLLQRRKTLAKKASRRHGEIGKLYADITDIIGTKSTARIPLTGAFSVRISAHEDSAYWMEYDGVGVFSVKPDRLVRASSKTTLGDSHAQQLRVRLRSAQALHLVNSVREAKAPSSSRVRG